MLRIRTITDPKPRERRLVPACLQQRAPHDYEIRTAADDPVPLSLVGYLLKPGTQYKLVVTSSHENAAAYELDFRTPKRIAEALDEKSVPQEKSRYVTFEANSSPTGLGRIHSLFQLTELSALSARIVYHDTREPYDLDVPIVIKRNPWLGILSLLGPAIFGIPIEVVRNQQFPDWVQIARLGLVGVAVWLVLFVIDNVRIWRKAISANGILDHGSLKNVVRAQKATEPILSPAAVE
jgi:hypothetical protein